MAAECEDGTAGAYAPPLLRGLPRVRCKGLGEGLGGSYAIQGQVPQVLYSLRGSSPRPMAHKTIALTTELRVSLPHS